MTAKGLWKWFRKHEKMILAAIVVLIVPAFGFGSILVASVARSAQDVTAAVIDGESLSYDELDRIQRRYYTLVNRYIAFQAAQNPRMAPSKVTNDDIYRHVRLVRAARDAGIRVPDEEIDEIIKDYSKFAQETPYIQNANMYFSNDEVMYYTHTLWFQLTYALRAGSEGFSRGAYLRYIRDLGIKEEDFRLTVEEILLVLKYKYYLWRATQVSTQSAYDTFRKKNVARRCVYVRFSASDFARDDEKIDEKELREYYNRHSSDFLEPNRKKVEYLHARVEDIRDRVVLTETEKRTFYETEKGRLFLVREEEGESGAGEDSKGPEESGGADGDGDGEGQEDAAEPKEEKDGGEGESEKKPEPRYKPFEDEAVQADIARWLSERKARDFLEALMGRISETVKRVEMAVRRDPEAVQNVDRELRDQIDFRRIAGTIAESADWSAPYLGFRPEAFRDDVFRSREELRYAFGPVGPGIADKAWELPLLAPSEVLPVSGGYVIFRVTQDQPPFLKPLEMIRDKVLEEALLSAQLDRAVKKAKDVSEKMKASSFEAVAREQGLDILETVYFRSRAKTIPGDGDHPHLGEAPTFIAAAFAPEARSVSRPVKEKKLKAVFLLKVLDERYPSAAEMPSGERLQLINEAQRKAWDESNKPWGEQFAKFHEIEDKTRDRRDR